MVSRHLADPSFILVPLPPNPLRIRLPPSSHSSPSRWLYLYVLPPRTEEPLPSLLPTNLLPRTEAETAFEIERQKESCSYCIESVLSKLPRSPRRVRWKDQVASGRGGRLHCGGMEGMRLCDHHQSPLYEGAEKQLLLILRFFIRDLWVDGCDEFVDEFIWMWICVPALSPDIISRDRNLLDSLALRLFRPIYIF